MYRLFEIKPRVTTPLVIVFGIDIFLWLNANYVGGILFALIVLGILFLFSGYVIDKENTRIRKETYFLGISFGKWYNLPKVKYVSILRVKIKRKSYSPSSDMYVQRSSKNYTYRVNLVVEGERLPKRLISTTQDSAIEHGLKIGEYLGVKVYDSSTSEPKWIS